MPFGLNLKHIEAIHTVLRSHPVIDRVIIYGSRAKGDEKKGSDIDLTLMGHPLNYSVLNRITLELDDLLLPYHIDLSIYDHIDNPDLIDHIKRIGKIFYEKSSA
jgi:predicted nucleotidyltransferase